MDFMVVIVVAIGFSAVIEAERCSYHFVDKKQGHLAMECRDIEFHHVRKYLSIKQIFISMLITGLHKSASEIGEILEALRRCHVVSIRMVFTSNFLSNLNETLSSDASQSRDRVGPIRSLEVCSQALALYVLANLRQLPSCDQDLIILCKLPNLRTFIEAKVPLWEHTGHRNSHKQCEIGHERTLKATDRNHQHLGMKRSLSAPEIEFIDTSSETKCVVSHPDLAVCLDGSFQTLIIDQGEVLFSLSIPLQELRSGDWLASPEPAEGKFSKSQSQRNRCSFRSLLLGWPSIPSDSVSPANSVKTTLVKALTTFLHSWLYRWRFLGPLQRAIPSIFGSPCGLRRAVSDPELARQSDLDGSSPDQSSSAFVKNRQVERSASCFGLNFFRQTVASVCRSPSQVMKLPARMFSRFDSTPKSPPETMDAGSGEGEGETRRNQTDDKLFRSASEQILIRVPDYQMDTQDHISSTFVPGGEAGSLDSSPRSLFRRAQCRSGQSLDCIWKSLGGSVTSAPELQSDGYVKYPRLQNPSQAKPLYKQIRPRLRRPASERNLMATENECNQSIIIQDAPNNNQPPTARSNHRPAGYKFRSSDETPIFASRRAAVFVMAGIAVFILLAIAKVVFFCKSDSSEESRLKRSDLSKQIDQFAFAKQLRGEGLSPLPTDLFVDFSTMPHILSHRLAALLFINDDSG